MHAKSKPRAQPPFPHRIVTPEGAVVAETALIEFRSSPIHGIGGFARSAIASGTRVIEYVGEKIDTAESLRRCEKNNEYIFALNNGQHIDGNVEWNPARFINHSCAPNCEAKLEEERIWLAAIREIKAGEEVTINYGFDLEDHREYICNCGAPGCIGYILAEEFFDHIRRQKEFKSA